MDSDDEHTMVRAIPTGVSRVAPVERVPYLVLVSEDVEETS